jgi:hypothetical protein
MLSICVCVCVCVSDVLVCRMSGCFTSTSDTHTHTTYSHIPDKQLDEANKRKCSSGTKHERRPPEDGQTVMTERCTVLLMCFKNIFNKFNVLNVNIGVC